MASEIGASDPSASSTAAVLQVLFLRQATIQLGSMLGSGADFLQQAQLSLDEPAIESVLDDIGALHLSDTAGALPHNN